MQTLTSTVLVLAFLVGADGATATLSAQCAGYKGVNASKPPVRKTIPFGHKGHDSGGGGGGAGTTGTAPPTTTGTEAGAATSAGGTRSGPTSGPTTAAGAGAPTRCGTRGGTDRTGLPDGVTEDLWWRWWDLNRLPLLLPDAELEVVLASDLTPRASRSTAHLTAEDAATARERLQPLLFAALQDQDPLVRAAAATAAGRLCGADAVPHLRALLDDGVQRVRESALLALGATGASQAAPFLLDLASRGASDDGSHSGRLSPDADALAWVALGLGRGRGFSDGVGSLVVDLAAGMPAGRLPALMPAALLYQRLSPGDDFLRVALERLDDRASPPDVRARCTESLGALGDPTVLPRLAATLQADELPLQRSAALALAGYRSAPLLAGLLARLGSGHDELLRGYLLLAVSRQEPGAANAALTSALAHGDAALRPWSALALGLLARRDDDVRPAIQATLRAEAAHAGSLADRQALLLASGLARDASRAKELLDLLAHDGNARTRTVAAQALTLLALPGPDGSDGSDLAGDVRLALKAQLGKEHEPAARGVLAESLGVHRDVRDVPALLGALADVHAGDAVADLVRGCGAHRTLDMCGALEDLVAERARTSAVRAAAWESLGLLLDGSCRSRLPDVIGGSELDALPDWCDRLLAESTL